MRLIVDANIFFAALVKPGITRRLWFDPKFTLYAPDFILTEIAKYQDFMLKKYDGSEEDFKKVEEILLNCVKFVPEKNLKPFLPAAASLSSDDKDWFYFACALYVGCGIWSSDKDFKKQSRVEVKTTEELAKETGYL